MDIEDDEVFLFAAVDVDVGGLELIPVLDPVLPLGLVVVVVVDVVDLVVALAGGTIPFPGPAPPVNAPVIDRLAPIRVKAIMAVTAFCQRLLTTYFFNFVLLNLVVLPFFAGVLANHL